MINVVLDTNVLVAALLSARGTHAEAFTKIIANPSIFNLVVSSQMLDEYRDVLSRSIIALRGLKEEADALLGLIGEVAEEVVPKAIPALVYPDEMDKPFLEAAVYVDGVLISDNTKDYPFAGVRIMKAGVFLRFVESLGI